MTQIELNEMTDRDLLVQVVTVLNDVSKKIETMAEQGMPRCEMHTQKMTGLDRRVGRFTKAAYACGLVFLADLMAKVVWK